VRRERKQYRRSGDRRPVHVVLLVRRTLALIMGGIKAFFVAASADPVLNAITREGAVTRCASIATFGWRCDGMS
jgi:hypothetical protein